MRGALTTEVWETQNQTWLELQPHAARAAASSATRAQFFEWVKFRSHLSRGVTVGTMLQDEAFHFLRLGTFLERADNTARLLDVKFHALRRRLLRHGAQQRRRQPASIDFYHWSAILRSVSGFEIYRKVYRDVIRPEQRGRAADPARRHAALAAACMNEVVANLQLVANEQTARRSAAPAGSTPTCSTGASTRSWRPGCMPT